MRGGVAVDAFTDLTPFRDAARNLGVELTETQLEQFRRYGNLLLAWNARINLTAIADPAAIQMLHFLDAVTLLPVIRRWQAVAGVSAPTLLDVGSGAGLPGLALKLVLPELQVTLLDGTGKRVAFLREAIEALGLGGIGAVQGRAEALALDPEWREWFDLVTARAVARLPVLLEWCLPLTRVGGLLLAPKAGDLEVELAEGQRAARELGGETRAPVAVDAPELPNRFIIAVEKRRKTAAGYPRARGLPKRHPLGVSPAALARAAKEGSPQ